MKRLTSFVLMFSAVPVVGASGSSATITFGEVGRDIGDQGSIAESGYQYTALGASWSLEGGYGSEGNALLTFWGISPAAGNQVTFRQVDDSPFLFLSLELRGRLETQPNDVVVAHGFLNGTEVASQVFQSSSETWRVDLANSGFATPINALRFELVEVNGSALMLDNVKFTTVPEPATCSLCVLGLFVLARMRRPKS